MYVYIWFIFDLMYKGFPFEFFHGYIYIYILYINIYTNVYAYILYIYLYIDKQALTTGLYEGPWI